MDLFNSPSAGFDAPFDMLSACHGRVQRMLDLLERLCGHLPTHGADEQARQAARDVMRYFDLAGPAHHEDEERHVFPALLAADPLRWSGPVGRLQEDHRRMAFEWARLRAALAEVAAGRPTPALEAMAAAFTALYAAHLATEDGEIYPAARALLDAETQAAMGREMAVRRGAASA
jgi:hemerythrin-like domain-containing protein